jgi:ribosome-associated translation inhibitor RaiA
MHLPLQITLRGLAHSAPLERLIRRQAQKLERFHSRLLSARVVVEVAGRHQHQGKQFVVGLDLKVPGAEIVIDRQHHEDPEVAVRNAFDAARRRLEDELRVQRGDVKRHAPEQDLI